MATTTETVSDAPAKAALWFSILGGPIAMFAGGAVNFVMIPWACGASAAWALWLASAGAALVAALAIFTGFRMWLRAGAEWEQTERGGPVPRGRFMAIVGMAVSASALLVILGQWIAALILSPCQ